jgi:hypothetical protein
MSVGILISAYALEDYIEDCLSPWLEFDLPMACSSFHFKSFEKKDNTKTIEKLNTLLNKDYQKCFSDDPLVLEEAEARNISLNFLKQQKVDSIFILDVDEFYSKKDIEILLEYIKDPDFNFCAWGSVNFKNYIFDEKTWVDGFCPPRFFNMEYRGLKLDKFYWDNDITYVDDKGGIFDYKHLPHITIPKNKLHIKHLTWMNNLRSKEKVEYQIKHFGHCSYKWNYGENKLEFDLDFYKKHNLPLPQLNHEN